MLRSARLPLVWISLALGGLLPAALAEEGKIDVGDRKQLLIDDRFIAESKNVTLHMNRPQKMGAVLLPDKPWESMDLGFCVSVIHHEGQYKMWYMARTAAFDMRICFARSTDGVQWEKPSLGVIEFDGSKDNNIVMAGVMEAIVFLDPAGPPEARFKSITDMHWPDPQKAGLYVHTSPDGIHWKMAQQRVLPLLPDTANQAFYDTRLKKYVAHIRAWAPMRKIARLEVDDITKPWPFRQLDKPAYLWGEGKIAGVSHEFPIVFGYDELDPPNSDHYNPACVQYPWADDSYFLFPSPYRHFRNPPVGKYGNDGLLDIQMATSRDGIQWTRLTRDPYVPLGLEGEIDSKQLYMAVGMVRSGNHIFQYYGGYNHSHGASQGLTRRGSICRLQQRLDGFVSADAAFEGGEFTTPLVTFAGSRLVLNINTSAMGTCKAEILDVEGNPVAGHSLADCDEIGGNFIEKTVTWKGNAALKSPGDCPIRLRFVMRAGKLFSFRFAPAE